MDYLIYEEQAGDKLKLVAEVEADEATEAVDALVDSDKKFGGREFVVFEAASRQEVTAGLPIVRSQSKGGRRAPAAKPAPKRQQRTRKPAASKPAAKRSTRKPAAAKAAPAEKAAPSKRSTRKPAAAASKPASRSRSTAKKPGGKPAGLKRASGIKANAASAE